MYKCEITKCNLKKENQILKNFNFKSYGYLIIGLGNQSLKKLKPKLGI